jgi:cysteine desulfurase family protein (TIGR01976 family)
MADWDIDSIRYRFPALRRSGPDEQPVAWLDNAAGTQVVDTCLRAINDYLLASNANHGVPNAPSIETDEMVHDVRLATADLLGATDADEISFGPNMTTITFALSRAIGATMRAGDEIVVTRLDHDANIAPWLAVAEARGLSVRQVGLRPDDATLDIDELERLVGPRTRLVAVGLVSNATGTINPVPHIASVARRAGAQLFVDAVAAAPHISIDVSALGADYLVFSPYKVYGPHLGVLWGRRELLEALPPFHVRPAGDAVPGRFETGTKPFELLAGFGGTIRYLEKVGVTQGGAPGQPGQGDRFRRPRLRAALAAIRRYEVHLGAQLLENVSAVAGVTIHGITDPARAAERCPTVAFTLDGHEPAAVARFLGERGLYVRNGDHYAWELHRALGLAQTGGSVRVSLAHYNTVAEIDRLRAGLEELVAR